MLSIGAKIVVLRGQFLDKLAQRYGQPHDIPLKSKLIQPSGSGQESDCVHP